MFNRDIWEAYRANQAKQWLNHPDRAIENAIDKAKRAKSDKANGHLTTCTLTKCSPNCKSN